MKESFGAFSQQRALLAWHPITLELALDSSGASGAQALERGLLPSNLHQIPPPRFDSPQIYLPRGSLHTCIYDTPDSIVNLHPDMALLRVLPRDGRQYEEAVESYHRVWHETCWQNRVQPVICSVLATRASNSNIQSDIFIRVPTI